MSELDGRTGLVSISFRKYTVDEIVKAVKEAGLSYIEWGSDVHAVCSNKEELMRIRRITDEAGLKCSSYGTYFTIKKHDIKDLYRYIEGARILGTDIVRIWCGNKDPEKYTEEEKEDLYRECKKIAEIGEKENVTFCMECHHGTYVSRAFAALDLMKYVDSESFKMYWQPNQFYTFEDNLDFADRISEYVKIVHVFNWRGPDRFPLSEGIPAWKEYYKKFRNRVIEGKTLFLLEFMPDDKIETLKREAAVFPCFE